MFWNINAHGNAPANFDKQGIALVSGYSPSIFMSLLGAENVSPNKIMLDTVMKDRYNYLS